MKRLRAAIVVVGLLVGRLGAPATAHPQSLPESTDRLAPRHPAASAAFPRLDVVHALGGYHLTLRDGRYPGYVCSPPPNCRETERREEPYTWARQIEAGISWTEHLATAVDVAWTAASPDGTRRDVYERGRVVTPSATRWVYLLHNYEIHSAAISQIYRFRTGRRWQPYLGVGLGIDRQTDSDSREDSVSAPLTDAERAAWVQGGVTFSDADTFPTSFPPAVTTTHVHAFGRVGFKAYAARRFFVLLETQIGARVAPLRAGVGVDLF